LLVELEPLDGIHRGTVPPVPRITIELGSSIRVPKLPLGWMKATVVPLLPGRGAWSIGVAPAAIMAASASAQSSTR
jgi:hypothetical protein